MKKVCRRCVYFKKVKRYTHVCTIRYISANEDDNICDFFKQKRIKIKPDEVKDYRFIVNLAKIYPILAREDNIYPHYKENEFFKIKRILRNLYKIGFFKKVITSKNFLDFYVTYYYKN